MVSFLLSYALALSDSNNLFACFTNELSHAVFMVKWLNQELYIVVLQKDCPDGIKKDGHFDFPEIDSILLVWRLQGGIQIF